MPTNNAYPGVTMDVHERKNLLELLDRLLIAELYRFKRTVKEDHEKGYLDSLIAEAEREFRHIDSYIQREVSTPQTKPFFFRGHPREIYQDTNVEMIDAYQFGQAYGRLDVKAPRVNHIMLATRQSERRILNSLEAITEQAMMNQEDVHSRILVGINNTTDDTFKMIRGYMEGHPELPMTLHLIQTPINGFAKPMVLNFLAAKAGLEMRATKWMRNDLKSYLTIMDDDVSVVKGSVFSNIEELERFPHLKAVSGTYVTTKETDGFHSVTSVRKRPNLLEGLMFPRLYGACLTLAFEDFPRKGIPLESRGEDSYLSLSFLDEFIQKRGGSYKDIDIEEVPVRTNPNLFLEHPEPHSLFYFAYRYLRDFEWRNETLRIFPKEMSHVFPFLQCKYFSKINERAKGMDKLLNNLNRSMRKSTKTLLEGGLIDNKVLQGTWTNFFERPEDFRWIKEFLKNDGRIHSAADRLKEKGILKGKDLEKVENAINSKQMFKPMQNAIRRSNAKCISPEEDADHDIRFLNHMINRNEAEAQRFEDPIFVGRILNRALGSKTEKVTLSPVMSHGRANFHVYADADGEKYFLRYQSPLGKEFLPRFSPSRTVYTYTMAQEILNELMGERFVIPNVYPSLDIARKNFQGWEEFNEVERALQRVIIQPDVRQDAFHWTEYESYGLTLDEAVRSYAKLMARLHAKSLKKAREENPKIRDILRKNYHLVRNRSTGEYSQWLMGLNWMTKMLGAQMKNPVPGTVYDTAQQMIGGALLKGKFEDTLQQSVEAFERMCCLGHFDFTPYNQFISKDDHHGILYDFDYISFVEPFYECGQGLYSLNRFLMHNSSDTDEPDYQIKAMRSFMDEYSSEFIRLAPTHWNRAKFGLAVEEGLQRAQKFMGYTTLAVVNEHENVDPHMIEPLAEICCEMIGGRI